MNDEDIRGKLDVLKANWHQLRALQALPKNDFTSNAFYLDSALHRLQTSIQALIDIGAYVVGALGLPTPQQSVEVIQALKDAGYIPAEEAAKYTRMVQFRNRVVHLYNRIDPLRVYEILQMNLGDLEKLQKTLVDIIARHPDPPGN